MSIEIVTVAIIAAVAAVAGIMVVMMRSAVHSALFLVLNFFCLAFLYLTLNAEFVAVVNIIVYAGAIMVLFLFVIFLINPTREQEDDRLTNQRQLGLGLGLGLLALVAAIVGRGSSSGLGQLPPPAPTGSNVAAVGELLYTRYLFPFEITSLILLAAIIGAVMLAKRHI